ncbi:HAD family hydrolase, partial [Jatrophihabitans sp. DSM 44399]
GRQVTEMGPSDPTSPRPVQGSHDQPITFDRDAADPRRNFRLDSTLLDHVSSVTTALRDWLPTLNATPTDVLLPAWFAAEERHFPAWRARQISFAEQRRRRLRDFLPLLGMTPGGDDTLDDIFASYLACYEAAWTKFDDVDLVITELRRSGLQIAVLTNGTTEHTDSQTQRRRTR